MIQIFNVKVLTPAMVTITFKINESAGNGHFFHHGIVVELKQKGMQEAIGLLEEVGWVLKKEEIPAQAGNGYDKREAPAYTRHILMPG